jgi:hypothetical protein
MPYQIYRTVDQHPPEIGMLTLVEELDARLNGYSVPCLMKSPS